MKKLVFGLGLLLSGVIGVVGWCIAVGTVFSGGEWIVLVLFAIMAVVGLFIAIKEVTQDEKSL